MYGGEVKTFYKDQFDQGKIKLKCKLQEKLKPFVKQSIFTTPVELAFDEPEGGFWYSRLTKLSFIK